MKSTDDRSQKLYDAVRKKCLRRGFFLVLNSEDGAKEIACVRWYEPMKLEYFSKVNDGIGAHETPLRGGAKMWTRQARAAGSSRRMYQT